MNNHLWVAMQYTFLQVEEVNGELVITTDESSAAIAKEEERKGCWVCEVPLNKETFQTKCPGQS